MDTDNLSNIIIPESMAAIERPTPPDMNRDHCHLQNQTRKNYPAMLPVMNPSKIAGISPVTKIMDNSKNGFPAIHHKIFPIIYFHTRPPRQL